MTRIPIFSGCAYRATDHEDMEPCDAVGVSSPTSLNLVLVVWRPAGPDPLAPVVSLVLVPRSDLEVPYRCLRSASEGVLEVFGSVLYWSLWIST